MDGFGLFVCRVLDHVEVDLHLLEDAGLFLEELGLLGMLDVLQCLFDAASLHAETDCRLFGEL